MYQNLSPKCAIGEPWRQNWEGSMLLVHKGGSGGSMSPYAFILIHSVVSHRSDLFHKGIEFFQRFQSRRERIHQMNRVGSIVDCRRGLLDWPRNAFHVRNGTPCSFALYVHGCKVWGIGLVFYGNGRGQRRRLVASSFRNTMLMWD